MMKEQQLAHAIATLLNETIALGPPSGIPENSWILPDIVDIARDITSHFNKKGN